MTGEVLMQYKNRTVLLAEAVLIALALSLAVMAVSALSTTASEWKDALKDALEKSYPLSHRATLSPDRITQQGVVLVIQKQGIAADPSSDARFSVTYVRDGQLNEQGGATVAFFGKTNARVFKPGEKVYVIGIKVGDDYVMLELMSCDMFDVVKMGSTKQTRYKAALSFKFDKESLPTLDVEKVKTAISPVVATETETAAQNTKTISLGQTTEQVEAILGKPEKIVNFGPKTTYIYKDMKVLFQDGKVADVQ
jgi:hypothetical protein